MISDFLKGFIIGMGKIIPGVSGTVFAMLFNVYETIIECISKPKLIIKHYKLILPLALGIISAIILGSNVINYFLTSYYIESMILFIGMISSGVVSLFKKDLKLNKKESIIVLIITIILLSTLFLKINTESIIVDNKIHTFISLILCGVIDAFSSIIPGISGSALLMLLGYYEIIINAFATINIGIIIPFSIGFILTVLCLSNIINYLFKKHSSLMNVLTIVFIVFSLISLILSVIPLLIINNTLIYIILFILGFIISLLISQ